MILLKKNRGVRPWLNVGRARTYARSTWISSENSAREDARPQVVNRKTSKTLPIALSVQGVQHDRREDEQRDKYSNRADAGLEGEKPKGHVAVSG